MRRGHVYVVFGGFGDSIFSSFRPLVIINIYLRTTLTIRHDTEALFSSELPSSPAALFPLAAADEGRPDHLGQRHPEALGHAAVDEEVERRVDGQQEVVHRACKK